MAQGHKRVTVNAIGCEFDFHSRKLNISFFHFLDLASRQSAALSSATQNASPEFALNWGVEYFNTNLPPLPFSCVKFKKKKRFTLNYRQQFQVSFSHGRIIILHDNDSALK